jgi:hypothetical protein
MAMRTGIDGGVEVSFEFRRHVGGKYIQGAVGLQFDDHFPYEFVSVAVWPTSDNYEIAIRESIEGVLMERLGNLDRTRVTLKSIVWDDVASCESGFRRAAKVATEVAFDV